MKINNIDNTNFLAGSVIKYSANGERKTAGDGHFSSDFSKSSSIAKPVKQDVKSLSTQIASELPLSTIQKMYLAVRRNNTSEIRNFLRQGVPPNDKFGSGSVLYEAIDANSIDAVKLMIESGANIEDREGPPRFMTPLHVAISKCNVAATRILLNSGANVWAHQEPYDPTLEEAECCDCLVDAEAAAAWYPAGQQLRQMVLDAMRKRPASGEHLSASASSPPPSKRSKTTPP